MKQFKVHTISNMWSTSRLTRDVEMALTRFSNSGYEIVSVSFGLNTWWIATAYITVSKNVIPEK